MNTKHWENNDFDEWYERINIIQGARGTCVYCIHRDKNGVCTKIRDIFGYELIVHDEFIFSDNFTFTEVE